MIESMCFIGNSHLRCLQLAHAEAVQAAGPGQKVSPASKFFIVPGMGLGELQMKDGVSYSSDPRSVRRFRSMGQGNIDVRDYDAFAVVGLLFSVSGCSSIYRTFSLWNHSTLKKQQKDVPYLISRSALEAALLARLSNSPAMRLVRTLKAHTDKPIYVIPQPNPMESALELLDVEKPTPRERKTLARLRNIQDDKVARDLYRFFLDAAKSVTAESGVTFLPQPQESISVTTLFTKKEYRQEHRELRDDRHANIAYGRLILDQVREEVGAGRSVSVAASAA